MTDSRKLYATLLGITEPWGMELVEMKQEAGEVHATVALPTNARWVCPECHAAAPIHDHRNAPGAISTPASSRPWSMGACRGSTVRRTGSASCG